MASSRFIHLHLLHGLVMVLMVLVTGTAAQIVFGPYTAYSVSPQYLTLSATIESGQTKMVAELRDSSQNLLIRETQNWDVDISDITVTGNTCYDTDPDCVGMEEHIIVESTFGDLVYIQVNAPANPTDKTTFITVQSNQDDTGELIITNTAVVDNTVEVTIDAEACDACFSGGSSEVVVSGSGDSGSFTGIGNRQYSWSQFTPHDFRMRFPPTVSLTFTSLKAAVNSNVKANIYLDEDTLSVQLKDQVQGQAGASINAALSPTSASGFTATGVLYFSTATINNVTIEFSRTEAGTIAISDVPAPTTITGPPSFVVGAAFAIRSWTIAALSESLTINAGAGKDTFYVGVSSTTDTTGSLAFITALLTLNGNEDANTVNLFDNSRSVQYPSSVHLNGTTVENIFGTLGLLFYSSINRLMIRLASGANNITIDSTSADLTDVIVPSTDSSPHTFFVTAMNFIAGTKLELFGGSGSDTFLVGPDLTKFPGLVLQGGQGTDYVVLDDRSSSTAFATPAAVMIPSAQLVRASLHSSANAQGQGQGTAAYAITFNKTDIEQVDWYFSNKPFTIVIDETITGKTSIFTSTNNDVIMVRTIAGQVIADGGTGSDSFSLGRAGITAPVLLRGGSGTDSLTWGDSANSATSYSGPVVNSTALFGVFSSGVTASYLEFESLTISVGIAASWTIDSPGAETTINGNSGADVFNIVKAGFDITINGQGSVDTVRVNVNNAATVKLTFNGGASSDILEMDCTQTSPFSGTFSTTNITATALTSPYIISSVERVRANFSSSADSVTFDYSAGVLTEFTVNLGSGSDSLTLDDSMGSVADNVTLSGQRVTGPRLSSTFVDYTNLESLVIKIGSAADSITIANTLSSNLVSLLLDAGGGNDCVVAGSSGLTSANLVAVSIYLQDGNDVLNLAATTAGTNIYGGPGNDAITLTAPALVQAGVDVNGGNDIDEAIVDATATVAPPNSKLTSTQVMNMFGLGGALGYEANVEVVTVKLAGGSAFVVQSTSAAQLTQILAADGPGCSIDVQGAASPVLVQGANGNDVITVGTNHELLIGSTITIAGGTGTDTVSLDDSGSDAAPQAMKLALLGDSFEARTVANTVLFDVYYSAVEDLQLYAHPYGCTVEVYNTTVAGTTVHGSDSNDIIEIIATTVDATIDSGDGNDAITVDDLGSIRGTISVLGGQGPDTLTVAASSLTTVGPLSSTAIAGPGVGDSLEYDGVEMLQLSLADSNSTLSIASTSTDCTTTIEGGAGDDTVNIDMSAGDLVVNGNGGYDVFSLGNSGTLDGITGTLAIDGGSDDDVVVLHDESSVVGRTLTVASSGAEGLSQPWDLASIEGLGLSLGSGDDYVTVIFEGLTFTEVAVVGNAGDDVLVLNNSADTAGLVVSLAANIEGMGAEVSYETVESLVVMTGSANYTVMFETAVTIPTRVETGDGSNMNPSSSSLMWSRARSQLTGRSATTAS